MTNPARTTDPAPSEGGVLVLDNPMPGGRLAWTVNRRLLGAAQPAFLYDTLSDGQAFDPGFTPVATLSLGGTTLFQGDVPSWSVVRNPVSGVSEVAFELGSLAGLGADQVSITFHSVIEAALVGFAPLSAVVGQGDVLTSSAVLAGQPDPPDTAALTLPTGSLGLSIYAVNGLPASGSAAYGDDVTYRLQLHLPVSAAQQVQIAVTLPSAPRSTVFDAVSGGIPASGHAEWGPDATYTAATPVVALDGAGGMVFQFGDLLPVDGSGMTDIDILFTEPLTGLSSSAGLQQVVAVETEQNSFGVASTSVAVQPFALSLPALTIQTASLYASSMASQFFGSGGPWGFNLWTSQFGGVVSSAGLDAEPFDDTLLNVDAGDEVTFVVAVQNRAAASAYDVVLRDVMPAGFVAPPEGLGLSVTDGAGNIIPADGDLFDPSTGLVIGAPLPGYDPDNGQNVVLVTFTLQASAALSGPLAQLANTAEIAGYAALPSGPSLTDGVPPAQFSASTSVTTLGIGLNTVVEHDASTLGIGSQAVIDVTLTLPEGVTRDLRLDELLPQGSGAQLSLVSAYVTHIGANLSTPVLLGALAVNNGFGFGTVVNTPDNDATADDTITVRLTVQAAGTQGGIASVRTVASATDPNGTAQRWTETQTNALAVVATNAAPTIGGSRGDQRATSTSPTRPLAGLLLNDADAEQVQTLTVQLSDPSLGRLGLEGLGTYDPGTGTFVAQGTAAAMQAAARLLQFTPVPGRIGSERFTVTLDDGAGGLARDSGSVLNLTPPSPAAADIQHFPIATSGSVLTQTATGDQTVAQIESYAGPVSYLQNQFIYDGTEPLVIEAQTPNIFIKSVAGSAAIKLLSGQNVVDAGHGSNFLIGGSGQDTFFLEGVQNETIWDTIVGFHPGDIATIWGYKAGLSTYYWDEVAGADGYTGRTMRADLTGSGHVEASLTFAAQDATDTAHYAITTGTVAGHDYMAIFNL